MRRSTQLPLPETQVAQPEVEEGIPPGPPGLFQQGAFLGVEQNGVGHHGEAVAEGIDGAPLLGGLRGRAGIEQQQQGQ
jgi:hypothetical protein